MIPSVTVCYICVSRGGERTFNYAARFVASWVVNPPGVPCKVIIACNGGALDNETGCLFAPLTKAAQSCQLVPRVNDEGKDIAAYQQIAASVKEDIFVAMGESCWFHRSGWLQPIVEAWQNFGLGMYGFFSSNLVRAHMNTTAFACAPEHLTSYPKVRKQADRYQFEHGENSLWRRLRARHIPVAYVSWNGVYGPENWRDGEDIMWRGSQQASLIFSNHTDRYFDADPETRFRWAAGADQPYR